MPSHNNRRLLPARQCKNTNNSTQNNINTTNMSLNNRKNFNVLQPLQNLVNNSNIESCKNINDIFKYVRSIYNEGTFKKIQSFTKLSKKVATEILHKKFLLSCREYDVFPKHVQNVLSSFKSFSIHSLSIKNKFFYLEKCISKKILNYLIKDTHNHVNYLLKNIKKLKIFLKEQLNTKLLHKFYSILNYILHKIKSKVSKKL